jgi:hypothetical protein
MVSLPADLSILTARAAEWLTRIPVFQTKVSRASVAMTKLTCRTLLTACAIQPRFIHHSPRAKLMRIRSSALNW